MNFCTRPLFNPWIQAHLYCLSHCYCQCLLLTLPHLSTTPILVVIGLVLVVTSIPTTTITTTKTGLITIDSIPLLLPTKGRLTGNRTNALWDLDSGPLTSFLSRMSSVNYALPSAIQLHNVHSFSAMASNPLPTLLLVMFMAVPGSRKLVWTNTLHLILQLWAILHPILVMIICMLVMVRDFPYWTYNVIFPKMHFLIIYHSSCASYYQTIALCLEILSW